MKKGLTIVLLVAAVLAAHGATAWADQSSYSFPSCGTVVNRNNSHQFGEFAWLEYIVETQGVFDICGAWFVRADAYVPGVANSGKSWSAVMYASVIRQVPVPTYGNWVTRGEHYATATVPNPFCCGFWWATGKTASTANVEAPDSDPDPEYECMLQGGTWAGYECQIPNCPIVVDHDRDGYKLTSVADGVRFDLDADGYAELVSWTSAGSDDQFLVLDRNGNGRIDDGSELVGNHMPIPTDDGGATALNGFEALAFLDSAPSANTARGIDANDGAFRRLLLWRDANHNGVSEPEELTALADAGVASIGTDYKEKRRVDRFGNQFRQKGTISWTTGGDEPVYDVWLKWRREEETAGRPLVWPTPSLYSRSSGMQAVMAAAGLLMISAAVMLLVIAVIAGTGLIVMHVLDSRDRIRSAASLTAGRIRWGTIALATGGSMFALFLAMTVTIPDFPGGPRSYFPLVPFAVFLGATCGLAGAVLFLLSVTRSRSIAQ